MFARYARETPGKYNHRQVDEMYEEGARIAEVAVGIPQWPIDGGRIVNSVQKYGEGVEKK